MKLVPKCISGVPIEKPQPTAPQWTTHNMSLWEDIVLLSSDNDHRPLLMINQTGVFTAPDIEKMENETLTKFQILKVILKPEFYYPLRETYIILINSNYRYIF